MLAAIYDPYLDTLGGGERYTISFAEVLKGMDYEVDIFWDDPEIRFKLESRFGLDLSGFNFLPNVFKNRNFMGTSAFLKNYDVVFMVSDGSIPVMSGKRNILHFQVPFRNVSGKKFANRLKLRWVNNIICNSRFTQKFINDEYGVDSVVVYPPIEVKKFTKEKKDNLILSVGRFSNLLQNKRQDILIDAFRKLHKKHTKWKLILAGGSDVGKTGDLDMLRQKAQGFPIEILENPDFGVIKSLYGKAKLFWFASGFGIDENLEPQKVEHFGMSVVEAMSAGCVPIVHPKGGITEIVNPQTDGFFWNSQEDIIEITNKLISAPQKMNDLSEKAVSRAHQFSKDEFSNRIKKLLV
jgi:glycosyltransferase involved in cell wall biosynthesis